ncbi:Taurine dioxygenase [Commensalibacter communis]|uniref:Alpha-ketoglutarate-dependent (TauD) n=1 Tax=Commensalibacter communis TaxID=2972786 RepID=A0A9W4TNT2_9PROT|nr:TauD/TfdA family dioxygenase [Commensalibacter communis]CAI3939681.1 Taurine dioxygenase [Commensalibacter communis]CAI3940678.1 Taurine dioxygenase [Commensalibacter communis]CAI3943829.1 Taurine dioxygenase [Commensalibacter communis]CAI3945970.1 Taurine dioxygenase [Commensalibacter communis]
MFEINEIQPFGAIVTNNELEDLCNIDTKTLIQLLDKYKILVLKNFEPMEDTKYINFCKSLGSLMQWEFGPLLNVRMEQDPKNHIFSKGRVELHWDGAFTKETPRINAFQCISSSNDGNGGETLFVDTTKIIHDTDKKIIEEWKKINLTYITEKKAHYGGTVNVKLVEKHPHKQEDIIRYIEINNEDNLEVNPVQCDICTPNTININKDNFLSQITKNLYKPTYMYRHKWSTGDYMLIDNNAVLHGRAKVEGNVNRHLKRIHIL